MLFQPVEARRPQLAVWGQPVVELSQRLWPDAVEAALRVDPRLHQACVPEYAKMLRHGGLTELKKLDQLANWPLAIPEQLQDGHPARLGQDLKRGQSAHLANILVQLYSCQRIY